MVQKLFLLFALLYFGYGLAQAGELYEINFDKIVFLSSWTKSGKVKLIHGEYHEPASPGSGSELIVKLTDQRAFGKLDGKEAGAVIVVTDLGGSGTFYDLALLVKDPQGWVNQEVVFLGDRVKIHSLAIKNNEIVVDMTIQGPGDPMCCPTRQAVHQFVLRDNRLVIMGEEVIGSTNPMLIGTAWRWQQSIYNNDTKAMPPIPENYTLKLLPDGKVSIRADCNLGGGIYKLEGERISIQITHTTRAACPPGSLEQTYIRDLNGAAIYLLKADVLCMDLKYDTGTMKFIKTYSAN
jgi:heat shock protein HslJ